MSNEWTYFFQGSLTIDRTLVSTDNVLAITTDMN